MRIQRKRVLRHRSLSVVFLVLLVFYVWHTAMPVVGMNTPGPLNMAVIVMLFGYMLYNRANFTFRSLLSILPLYLLQILDMIIAPTEGFGTSLYGLIQLMVLPLCSIYLLHSPDEGRIRGCLWFILLGYFITCITTYFGCLEYPGASRELATMLLDDDPFKFYLYKSLNIGSFSFVYTIVLLIPLLLYLVRDRRKNYIFAIIFIVVSVFTIIESEYTTALLMTLGAVLLFFLPRKFDNETLKKYFLIIGIIVIVVWSILPAILEMILPYIKSSDVSTRIDDLVTTLNGENIETYGDVDMRREKYQVSLDAFISSPIFGTFNISAAGGHSLFLDTLAKYGLIGLGLLIYMFRQVYVLFIRPFKPKPFYGYILYVFIMAIAMAVLNPKDNLMVIAFIMPLFCRAYLTPSKTRKNESPLGRKQVHR